MKYRPPLGVSPASGGSRTVEIEDNNHEKWGPSHVPRSSEPSSRKTTNRSPARRTQPARRPPGSTPRRSRRRWFRIAAPPGPLAARASGSGELGSGNATLRLRSCNPRCGTGTSGSESVGEDMNALPWSAVQASRSTSTRCRSLSPSNDDGYLVHEDGWPRRLSPRSAPPGARHERSNAHLGGACSRSSYETLMRMYAAVRDSPAAMVVLYREHEAGSEAAREPPTLRVILWSSSKQHAGVVAVV